MLWTMFPILALLFVASGKYLKTTDDVYALTCYCCGSSIALYGFLTAPPSFQLSLEITVLTAGCLRLATRNSTPSS